MPKLSIQADAGNVLDVLLDELAERLAAKILERQAPPADELVTRKTAPIAMRVWDRYAGKPDGFPAFKNGRRIVAKRSDVMAFLERQPVERGRSVERTGDVLEDGYRELAADVRRRGAR